MAGSSCELRLSRTSEDSGWHWAGVSRFVLFTYFLFLNDKSNLHIYTPDIREHCVGKSDTEQRLIWSISFIRHDDNTLLGGGGGHCHWMLYQMRENCPQKSTLNDA